MSKKVLIIKPATYIDWKDEKKFTEALSESITESGIICLPYCIDYEFGEIDGVIWEGEKKDKKESTIDDFAKVLLDRFRAELWDDPVDGIESGHNRGLRRAMSIVDEYIKEKTNE